MSINLALTRRFPTAADDPMGRLWAGWDRTASDDDLWEANRGRWRLSEQAIADERFATLSFGGVVQVAAEITGFELISAHPKPGFKKLLHGNVLRPGDPVRDALVGRPSHGHRNPVGYLDTSDVDDMPPAERAAPPAARQPTAFLLTNNPANWAWDPDDYAQAIAETEAGRLVKDQWSIGSRTGGIEPGDRVFLLRQGTGGRGIVGSGACTSRAFRAGHWDADRPGDEASYVLVDWDTLLDPEDGLRIEALMALPGAQHWEPQTSGTAVRAEVLPELERLWVDHLGRPNPPRTAPRQGWQMDAERRRKVENAAQDRLMRHYRNQGWAVKDTRHGNSFDAIARKGRNILYLEAKGTETAGSQVIVTRGEVEHARAHSGKCVIGILSDVRFGADGEIVAGSGKFRIYPFSPKSADLAPRSYDYGPAGPPLLED